MAEVGKAEKKVEEIAKEAEKIKREAKSLGVSGSRVSLSGFKDKKPEKIEKEEKRHKKLVTERLKNRIAKAKIKMKPIEKRRAVLVARFKAVRSRRRPRTYSNTNIEAWIEELNMIDNNPKSWNAATKNGTVGFVPGNKKKKTAKDILDGMDLE